MAFIKKDFAQLAVGLPGYLRAWRYTTPDSLLDVLNPIYFAELTNEVQVGDIILCQVVIDGFLATGWLAINFVQPGSLLIAPMSGFMSLNNDITQIKGGTVIAAGAYNFSSGNTTHTISITGVSTSDVAVATVLSNNSGNVAIDEIDAQSDQVVVETEMVTGGGDTFNLIVVRV